MNLGTLTLGFILLLPATLWAQTNAPALRIALVGIDDGEATRNVLALAEVELSKAQSVVLLERGAIQRILQEQRIAHSGLTDSRQAVALGKLLGVEVFAVFENFPGEQGAVGGLVAFNASTGVKLSDETIIGRNEKEQANNLRSAVLAACAKAQRRTTGSRTVSVAAVRNADLPRELDSSFEAIARMLQRRLVASAEVTLLERERLEQINRERALPTSGPTAELLASLTLLELEFARSSGVAEVAATVLLSDPVGAALGKFTVTGSLTNVSELVERLADGVTRQQAIAPAWGKLDSAREAARFYREAQWLVNHHYFSRGLEAAEAACALVPASEEYQHTLASMLMQAALDLLATRPGVAPAERPFQRRAAPAELLKSLQMVHRARSIQEVDVMPYLTQAAQFEGGPAPESQDLFESLQRECRDKLIVSNLVLTVTNLHGFQQFTYWGNYHALPKLQYLTPTARDWTRDSIEIISRWLRLAEKHPPAWDLEAGPPYYSGGSDAVNRLLAWPFVGAAMNPEEQWPSPKWKLSAEDYRRWDELYESMRHHPAPVVQTYGKIGQLAVAARTATLATNDAPLRMNAIVADVKTILARLPPESPDSLRLLYYQAALDAIHVLPPEYLERKTRWTAHTNLLDFMCQQRELADPVVSAALREFGEAYVVRPALWPGVVGGRGERRLPDTCIPALLQSLNRITNMIESPGVRLLGGEREAWDKNLARIRHELVSRSSATTLDTSKPWASARPIFQVADDMERIGEAVVQGDVAYLICLGWTNGGRCLQPVRVSIPDGHVQMLGRVPHHWDEINDLGAVITGVGVSETALFVGTRRDGVFIFPKDGGPPQHLTTADGLPSNWVCSLAVLDSKLFLGLGDNEGFLVVYDLQTHVCEVIASSRRKDKRSPFDDLSPPFSVHALRSDSARKRVIALITAPPAPSGEPLAGLWLVNPPSGELKQLLRLQWGAWLTPNWLSPIRNNRLLLNQHDPRCLIEFDLEHDKTTLLYARGRFPVTQLLQPSAETVTSELHRSAPFLLVYDSLWTGVPFGGISRANPEGELFPPLPGDRDRRFAFSIISLESVGSGRQVLVVERRQVWLLTLPWENQSKDLPR